MSSMNHELTDASHEKGRKKKEAPTVLQWYRGQKEHGAFQEWQAMLCLGHWKWQKRMLGE